MVSAGGYHTCVVRADTDATYCYGSNDFGQLGSGSYSAQRSPARVVALAGVRSISCGERHTCAVSNGAAWCWGSNSHGQLGAGTAVPVGGSSNVPVRVQLPGSSTLTVPVISVTAAATHSCALLYSGWVACW